MNGGSGWRENVREEKKEDNGCTEYRECDIGMGQRDEVVGELYEDLSEETEAAVS